MTMKERFWHLGDDASRVSLMASQIPTEWGLGLAMAVYIKWVQIEVSFIFWHVCILINVGREP